MKNLLLFLITLIFFSAGCTKQKNITQQVTFYDSAFIRLTVINCHDTTHLEFMTLPMLPNKPVYKSVDITHDGTYYFSHKTIKPDIIDFDFKRKFQTYVIPGDTLKIYANLDPGIKEEDVIKIDGVFGQIFDFYDMKQKIMGFWNESLLLTEFSNNKYTLERSISLCDSIFQADINFLNVYQSKHSLPDWFYKTLKAEYQYKRIWWRPYIIAVRKFFFKENIMNPEKYYIFDELPLNNPGAILSDMYYNCVEIYFMSQHDHELEGKIGIDRAFPLFVRSIPDAEKTLKGKVLEFYLARKISDLFEISRDLNQLKMCDSLLCTIEDQFTDDEILKILKNQKDQREKNLNENISNAKELNKGDKAPELELLGLDNKLHSLTEFKGKIIYLHFWATWCEPCISEIPFVNELINKTSKSDLIVVNICLDNQEYKWKKLIHEKGLKGVNLICDDKWSKKLISSYNISAIPKYALVNKTGLVIDSNYDRPNKIIGSVDSLIGSIDTFKEIRSTK